MQPRWRWFRDRRDRVSTERAENHHRKRVLQEG
jgi:hypothetical protein